MTVLNNWENWVLLAVAGLFSTFVYIWISAKYKNTKNVRYIRNNIKQFHEAFEVYNADCKLFDIANKIKEEELRYREIIVIFEDVSSEDVERYLYLVEKQVWLLNDFYNRTADTFDNNLIASGKYRRANKLIKAIRNLLSHKYKLNVENFKKWGNFELQFSNKLKENLEELTELY